MHTITLKKMQETVPSTFKMDNNPYRKIRDYMSDHSLSESDLISFRTILNVWGIKFSILMLRALPDSETDKFVAEITTEIYTYIDFTIAFAVDRAAEAAAARTDTAEDWAEIAKASNTLEWERIRCLFIDHFCREE